MLTAYRLDLISNDYYICYSNKCKNFKYVQYKLKKETIGGGQLVSYQL